MACTRASVDHGSVGIQIPTAEQFAKMTAQQGGPIPLAGTQIKPDRLCFFVSIDGPGIPSRPTSSKCGGIGGRISMTGKEGQLLSITNVEAGSDRTIRIFAFERTNSSEDCPDFLNSPNNLPTTEKLYLIGTVSNVTVSASSHTVPVTWTVPTTLSKSVMENQQQQFSGCAALGTAKSSVTPYIAQPKVVAGGKYVITFSFDSGQTKNVGEIIDLSRPGPPIEIAPGPLPARQGTVSAWTGTHFIVWGGVHSPSSTTYDLGYWLDPKTNVWLSLTMTGGPALGKRKFAESAWLGTEMLIFGGQDETSAMRNEGAIYRPLSNSWVTVTTTNAPSKRAGHSMTTVYSDVDEPGKGEVFVFGGYDDLGNNLNDGAIFRGDGGNSGGTWTTLGTSGGPPSGRIYHTAVKAGGKIIVWGGRTLLNFTGKNDGRIYDPTSPDPWSAMSDPPSWFLGRYNHNAVWTGRRMLVWGGWTDATTKATDAAEYDPVTDTWTRLAAWAIGGNLYGLEGAWTPYGLFLMLWTGNAVGSNFTILR